MGKASFKTLLRALGFLMARASRKHPWFRNQVTRDLVIEFKSHDGVAHHYEFVAARREVISKQGPASRATVSVCFDSAAHGFRALSHPHPVSKVINSLLDRTATAEGNVSLLLWFHGLTRIVIPIARHVPLKQPLPGALMKPNPESKVYHLVTREPVAPALDPKWTIAAEARSKLINLRALTGEAVPMW